ncbi:MAG: hypothetical protein R2874_13605 [Desulfobacterales bacterium]
MALQEMRVFRSMQGAKKNPRDLTGVWLSSDTPRVMMGDRKRTWLWLPPVIWPDDQGKYRRWWMTPLNEDAGILCWVRPGRWLFQERSKIECMGRSVLQCCQ